MGCKVENTYYSNREITTVLERHKHCVKPLVSGEMIVLRYDAAKGRTIIEDAFEVFKKIVNKKLNQSKQEFLDSL